MVLKGQTFYSVKESSLSYTYFFNTLYVLRLWVITVDALLEILLKLLSVIWERSGISLQNNAFFILRQRYNIGLLHSETTTHKLITLFLFSAETLVFI